LRLAQRNRPAESLSFAVAYGKTVVDERKKIKILTCDSGYRLGWV